MKKFTAYAMVAAIAITLGACGGGGSSSSPPPESTPASSPTSLPSPSSAPAVQTGQFLDSAVEGLRYVTTTQSGTTGKGGDFKYMAGEEVIFYLYGTQLNTAAASVVLTPADSKNVSVDYSVNLLRFLQTVDTDNDPSNGITLPTVEAADQNYTINLQQDLYTFETDPKVLAFITKYAAARTMVSIKNALTHFNSTLENVGTDVILDVTGKTIKHTEKDTLCNNSDVAFGEYTYVFSADGLSYVSTGNGFGYGSYGTYSYNVPSLGAATCYKFSDKNGVFSKTVTFTEITNPMNTFLGGPKFTYKTMNRIGIRPATVQPSNGLESIVVIWHTPGTKTIHYQRRYIKTAGIADTVPLSTQTWIYTWE